MRKLLFLIFLINLGILAHAQDISIKSQLNIFPRQLNLNSETYFHYTQKIRSGFNFSSTYDQRLYKDLFIGIGFGIQKIKFVENFRLDPNEILTGYNLPPISFYSSDELRIVSVTPRALYKLTIKDNWKLNFHIDFSLSLTNGGYKNYKQMYYEFDRFDSVNSQYYRTTKYVGTYSTSFGDGNNSNEWIYFLNVGLENEISITERLKYLIGLNLNWNKRVLNSGFIIINDFDDNKILEKEHMQFYRYLQFETGFKFDIAKKRKSL